MPSIFFFSVLPTAFLAAEEDSESIQSTNSENVSLAKLRIFVPKLRICVLSDLSLLEKREKEREKRRTKRATRDDDEERSV